MLRRSFVVLAALSILAACGNEPTVPATPTVRPTFAIAATSTSTLLVDTGPGATTGEGSGLFAAGSSTCGPQPQCAGHFQFLAAQFTLSSAATLQSVQVWMTNDWGGPLELHIRTNSVDAANNLDIPGASVFSKTYTLAPRHLRDWETFAAYDVALAAGTYWISLEPVAGGDYSGALWNGAPNPLANYAFHADGNFRWMNMAFFGSRPAWGIRIAGVARMPADLLADLRATLAGLALPKGHARKLDAALTDALAAIDAGHTALACAFLQDFVDAVEKKSDKKIAAADAASLIAAATAIRAALGC